MPRRTGERLLLAAVAAALALATPPARADEPLRVEASVDRTELALDETLVLTVRVEADDTPAVVLDRARLPFTVRDESHARSATFAFGGASARLRRVHVWTWTLAPRRAGDLSIPPVTATVKGARRSTDAIAVKVLPAAGRPPAGPPAPRSGGGAWRGWERDLALRVTVDRREAFVGEQVTATVSLLSPVGVVSVDAASPPPLDGFWVERLETPARLQFRVEDVGGVPTRVYLLQRLALFPTRPGEVELAPWEIELTVRVASGSLFGELRRARRASAPVKLRVKPLPPGAPAGFDASNVGSYRLEATADAAEIVAGQPVRIRLTAKGDGNVGALALPRLPELAGARRFEPTAADAPSRRNGRVGGARTVETVVVPERPGRLEVPALAWPFFDPRAGRYEVARTATLAVTVLPAPAAPAAATADPLAALHPPRAGALERPRPPPWSRGPFLLALATPPLAFAAAVAWDLGRRRAARGAPARRARAAGKVARRRLATAARHLDAGDRRRFLDDASGALAAYLADRLGRPVAGLTRADLAAALAGAGAAPEAIAALVAALEACDAARFGAGAASERDVGALAERAIALLEAPAAGRAP